MCAQAFERRTVIGQEIVNGFQEEQQGGQSANYDVELLHPAEAHDDLFISGDVSSLTSSLFYHHDNMIKQTKFLLGINLGCVVVLMFRRET